MKKFNDHKMESETKELLLQTATTNAGDDTNERMDEDGNNNNAALSPIVETINGLHFPDAFQKYIYASYIPHFDQRTASFPK